MSEMTPCNHCSLSRIKSQAKRVGKQVSTKKEDGGVGCYVDGKRVSWFMELTDYCCC